MPPEPMAFFGLRLVVDGRLHVGVVAVRARVEERREPGDLVVVQQPALDGHEDDQRRSR